MGRLTDAEIEDFADALMALAEEWENRARPPEIRHLLRRDLVEALKADRDREEP